MLFRGRKILKIRLLHGARARFLLVFLKKNKTTSLRARGVRFLVIFELEDKDKYRFPTHNNAHTQDCILERYSFISLCAPP